MAFEIKNESIKPIESVEFIEPIESVDSIEPMASIEPTASIYINHQSFRNSSLFYQYFVKIN